MPTISGRTSLAIGLSTANVFLGSQYELAPFDGTIEVGILAARDLVDCAIFSGPDVLAEPGSFVPFDTALRTPRYPDDYHWEDEVAHGDRLKLTLHNGNVAAGPDIILWALRATPA